MVRLGVKCTMRYYSARITLQIQELVRRIWSIMYGANQVIRPNILTIWKKITAEI
ncbi:hypothetical protein D3C86_1434120 [compost metagenome]